MLTQPLLEWFEVTPSPKKLAALLVLLGAVTVLFYGVVIGPRLNQIMALQKEVQLLEENLKTQIIYSQKRTNLSEEVSSLHTRYQALREAVGMPLAATAVLSDILKAANRAGVSLTLWKPETAAPVQSQDIYKTATRLEVEGNYHGLATFFDELSRLPKAFGVNAFSISASHPNQEQKTIQVWLDLVGYESSGLSGFIPSQTGPAAGLPEYESD